MLTQDHIQYERTKHIEKLKKTVIAAGGIWVGIQETIPEMHDLVLFNAEGTRTTLAIPDDEFFTINSVQAKIAASNKEFLSAKVKIPRGVLQDLTKSLRNISDILESYLGE